MTVNCRSENAMHSKKSEVVLNSMGGAVCKGCLKRCVGCHSTCAAYAAERAENERKRQEAAALVRRDKDYADYVNQHIDARGRRGR